MGSECLGMVATTSYQPIAGLSDIRELRDLKEEAVRDILRANLGDQGLSIRKMGELEDMSGTNDAFNSSICSLEVTVEYSSPPPAEGGERQNTFHFVIKSPPKAGFIRTVHKITKPFLNEVTWYCELLPQVGLVTPHLPPEFPRREVEPVQECPRLFHAHSNYYCGEAVSGCSGWPWLCWLPLRQPERGLIVMADMKRQGYSMYDKMRVLPLDHVTTVMTQLAHFHGRWLAYRWLNEAGRLGDQAWSMERFLSALDTQKRVPKLIYKELLNGTRKTVKHILQLEGCEEGLLQAVDNFYSVSARQQLDMFMGGLSTLVDTCCHGDFWGNNIMYKYSQGGQEVVDTSLVDFQLINYGHPAYDLLYLLYISVDTEFRAQHMEACLAKYWETFQLYIKEFKPEGLEYNFSNFQADLSTYKTVGFVLATTLLPNVLSSAQVEPGGLLALREIQRKQARELEDLSLPSTREIRRRVVGLCRELHSQGVF